jgi:hypothetical protein
MGRDHPLLQAILTGERSSIVRQLIAKFGVDFKDYAGLLLLVGLMSTFD